MRDPNFLRRFITSCDNANCENKLHRFAFPTVQADRNVDAIPIVCDCLLFSGILQSVSVDEIETETKRESKVFYAEISDSISVTLAHEGRCNRTMNELFQLAVEIMQTKIPFRSSQGELAGLGKSLKQLKIQKCLMPWNYWRIINVIW